MSLVRLAVTLIMLSPIATVADDIADIEGVWINGDGDGWIELTIDDGELQGRIIGSPDDLHGQARSRLDTENPDPALRQRELRGLVILTGFRFAGDGEWKDGRIYDPNTGNTYKGTIRQVGANELALRGYIGISLFGRTESWRRRQEPHQ